MLPAFEQMVVLFLMLALGFIAGKTKVMTTDGNKVISRLVNCITNPCNILYSSLCCEHVLSNREVFGMLGVVTGSYALLILLAQFIPRLLRVPRSQLEQYQFMVVFNNCGYMGIPVVAAIFGPEAVFCVAIFVMGFSVLVFTYGVYLIRGGRAGGAFRLRDIFSPMFVSAVLSLIFYLCRLQVGGVAAETLDAVRQVTTPCAMMVIGCALASVPLRDVFGNWRLYVISLLKLLVIPVCAYLLLRPVKPSDLRLQKEELSEVRYFPYGWILEHLTDPKFQNCLYRDELEMVRHAWEEIKRSES